METGSSIRPQALVVQGQPPALARRAAALGEWFAGMTHVLVAYSGGVDSALVAFGARRVLGRHRVCAVIADSPSLPRRELAAAEAFARQHDIPLEVVETREGEHPGYVANRGDRCYFCKRELYTVLDHARLRGTGGIIVNGTNADDPGEWRPGLRAAEEMEVRSPLLEVGFGKQDVRALSRSLGLQTWEKPALPCLASRIPYGHEVTPEKLAVIERAEDVLWNEGFRVFRVRHHDRKAVLEIGTEELARLGDRGLLQRVLQAVRRCGFERVELDPRPYRRGRLNEALEPPGIGAGLRTPLQVRMPSDP